MIVVFHIIGHSLFEVTECLRLMRTFESSSNPSLKDVFIVNSRARKTRAKQSIAHNWPEKRQGYFLQSNTPVKG